VKIGGGEGIGLGNDRDQVHASSQALHDFDVQGLQGVAGGANKVQAAVDAHIAQLLTLGLLVLTHVRLVLVVNKVDDGHPAVAVVGVVSESRRVDYRQLNSKLLLLQLYENKVAN
jgi:hypothetical protein